MFCCGSTNEIKSGDRTHGFFETVDANEINAAVMETRNYGMKQFLGLMSGENVDELISNHAWFAHHEPLGPMEVDWTYNVAENFTFCQEFNEVGEGNSGREKGAIRDAVESIGFH